MTDHHPTLGQLAAALGLACALLAHPTARAATFSETFNGPGISPQLVFSASDPGIHFNTSGGWGDLSKADGVGNGFGYLRTSFQVVGDFTASVTLLRDGLVGQGEAGLNLRFFSTYPDGFADVWSQGLTTLVANAYLPTPPGYGTTTLQDHDAVLSLGFVRIGQTLTYFVGGGTMRAVTGPELTGPVTLELFMGQEANQTVGHHALFDNLFIRGEFVQAPVPEPSTSALFGAGLAALGALARRRSAQARRSDSHGV